MTQDEIIEMARQAGFFVKDNDAYSPSVQEDHELTPFLVAFANLVAAKEREALAQHDSVQAKTEPEQEPVAWMYQEYRDDDQFGWRDEIAFIQPPNDPIYFRNIKPVCAPTPQRTWVGLTFDEIDLLEELYAPPVHPDFVNDADHCLELIRHVEAKLKQKNGYAEEKNKHEAIRICLD